MKLLARLFDHRQPGAAGPWLTECGELCDRGEFDKAADFIRVRLPSIEKARGEASEEVSAALLLLGISLANAGKLATLEFQEIVSRALDLETRLHGPEDPIVAMHLEALAESLMATGDEESAETLLRQRLALWENRRCPDDAKLVECLHDLALVRYRRGDNAEATRFLERAIGVAERVHGLDSPDLLPLLEALAEVLEKTGDLRETLAVCKRIIGIQERVSGPESNELAMALGRFAFCLRDIGGVERDLVRAWYARALTILSQKPVEHLPPELRERISQRRGSKDE